MSHHFCQSDRGRRAALPHAKQAALGVLILGSLLAGCAGDNNPPPAQPAFYQSMARADARIDGPTAASMISGYRQNNGLGGISVDPALMALAQQQAQAMATRDKLDHNVIKPLTQRIKASGYPAAMAVENVSAGYHTLAEAFSGWRDSPPHRANMLAKGATRMGIATAYAPGSKYKVFWALILAAPDGAPRE